MASAAQRLGAEAVDALKGLVSPLAMRRTHARQLRMVTMPINSAKESEKFKRRGLDVIQTVIRV